MRSFFENKRLVLLLAALALGALTVLAVSLNDVPFRAAQHFGVEKTAERPLPPADPMPQILMNVPLWKQLLAAGLVVLLMVLIIMLLSPKWRKRLLWLLVKGLIWVAAIYILLTNPILSGALSRLLMPPQLQADEPAGEDAFTPIPVFEPPQVSSTLAYAISFAFALLLLVVLWFLYRGWQNYVALNQRKPLEEIARIARSSLNDLSSGRNSSDVIINCYLRMSDVVSSKQQLHREIAMTPREFALRLERAGLPGEAVKRLTGLFEGVRYGDRKSAPQDVNEAVSCLKTILHYCGEPV
ncbi:MAG: DUF4129 domain-containing protein [Anaerolineales bacterium]|nr:DUF4129 domain-containing protein [Anaerolineales bacterium]